MKNKIAVVFFVVAIAFGAVFFYYKYRVAPKVNVPLLSLTYLDGKPFDIGLFEQKNVFINFFATWCGPCMGEMNSLQEAQNALEADDYLFVCISDEEANRILGFKERTNSRLVFLRSTIPLKELGIVTWPTNYVLNKKGEIKYRKVGIEDWSSNDVVNALREINHSP
jgi:thiol-disulfide isomerase/thioredoxin